MKSAILRRVFERLNKETVIEVIQTMNKSWEPTKKQRRIKKELLADFLNLADLINDESIEDFVEMAVMTKQIGLPAFTYKINSITFLDSLDEKDYNTIKDYPFLENFSVSVEEAVDRDDLFTLQLRIKEYKAHWRHGGVLDRNSLTAVYKINISLDKEKKKVTFNAGNDAIHEVTRRFVSEKLKWPISAYRIIEKASQSYQIGNANFKTAILLDFIENRLSQNGIKSKFKEIKFDTKGKVHQNEGIRNVTINGRDILSSQLACQYITMGSGIASFKLSISYGEQDFSAIFSLKGKDSDLMKIVIVDIDDTDLKEEILELIQEHYIAMCIEGIKDMDTTKRILETIYDKYTEGDKFVFQVIQDSMVKVNSHLSNLLRNTDIEDDFYEIINDIVYNNKIILDAAGYNGIDDGLEKIKEILESNFSDLDEDDSDNENEDDDSVSEKEIPEDKE
ncbi:hypothetical protein [Bacillus suaedae]|uniref:Uncharacterized protein n=1 Tax=Halalkalibacter suaedae TaxID=2822140 RepID=A0A941ANU2_9BACI|nr:hypothetical protein [Bacillus suaedae]MBP3951161.1 hypothetical protein [Bacillus suaedae]